MNKTRFIIMLIVGLLAGGMARGEPPMEWHKDLQAIEEDGTSAWEGAHPFRMQGVLLNNPEEMLDSTWDSGAETENQMGAQWQIFFQAVDPDDRGGTACWMGQNYTSLGPWIPAGNVYSEAEWSNEMQRVNFDGAHQFRRGDLIEVTARQSLFYGGKRNINEAHRTSPDNDFDIALIEAGHGLPDPEVITLADLVTSGTDEIFDQTRQSGGEYYQAMRVRIESIRLTTNYFGSSGWGQTHWADRRCTVTDGEGRYFNLRMPLTDLGPPPEGWFTAVGILNQESGSGSDGTHGYELFVQEIGPELRVVSQGGKMLLYWSGTYTNYNLEYTTDLTGESGWERVTSPPEKWIAVEEDPAENGDPVRIYRLKQKQ